MRLIPLIAATLLATPAIAQPQDPFRAHISRAIIYITQQQYCGQDLAVTKLGNEVEAAVKISGLAMNEIVAYAAKGADSIGRDAIERGSIAKLCGDMARVFPVK